MFGSASLPLLRSIAGHSLAVLAFLTITACATADISSNKDPDYTGTITKLHYQSSVSEEIEGFGRDIVASMSPQLQKRGVATSFTHDVYAPKDEEGEVSLEDDRVVEPDFTGAGQQSASHVLVVELESREVPEYTGPAMPENDPAKKDSPPSMEDTHSGELSYTFAVSLYVTETQDRVWRATVKVKGDGIGKYEFEARGVAKSILEQLEVDQLVPAPVSSTS